MHRQYEWLPEGEFPHRPGWDVAQGLARLARSTRPDDHDDIIEIAMGRGKAEVRLALEAVALQREATRAKEFRLLQWLILAVAAGSLVSSVVQVIVTTR